MARSNSNRLSGKYVENIMINQKLKPNITNFFVANLETENPFLFVV
jgi:hypothetical protein